MSSRVQCQCIRVALRAAFSAVIPRTSHCIAGCRLAAHRRAASRTIGRARAAAWAVSPRMACLCCRATHRAAYGPALRTAVPRADVLPRTRPACGHRRVRRGADCSGSSATGPRLPGANAGGKCGRQDKRGRHLSARKASLHVGGRGTQRLCRRAAWGVRHAPIQACPRASHARTRQSLQGAQA